MKTGVFITGTNTDIGKTVTTAMIITAALAQSRDIYYFKPIQTGTVLDCDTIKTLTTLPDTHIIQPVFSFSQPQAPYRAAAAENQKITLDAVIKRWQSLPDSFYLVEGAGGLLTPLTSQQTIRELAQALDLPLVIVASTQLGTINHTLLTVEAALAADINLKGLILVGDQDPGLAETLQHFTALPILCEIPVLDFSTAHFRQTAARIFQSELLQRLLT